MSPLEDDFSGEGHNGVWLDFDAMPSSWGGVEEQSAALWEPFADLWHWASLRFSHWRSSQEIEAPVWAALAGLLLAVFLWWLWHTRKHMAAAQQRRHVARVLPGQDSEYYLIEKRVAEWGYGREQWESPDGWLGRAGKAMSAEALIALRDIVALHQRYRFDPQGLGVEERNTLKVRAQRWLTQHGGAK